MKRNQTARASSATARRLIPASVRLRVTLAMIVIVLPSLILLAIALHGQTQTRVEVTAILAALWTGAVLLIVVRVVEGRVLRPLRHLTHVVSQLADGKLDSRVDLGRIRMVDLRTLGTTVNAMAGILEKLALTDGLTAIANRRQFDAVIASEVKRSIRMKTSIALLLIDVDKFKNYNDLYGHAAGDRCLKQIALALQGALQRTNDLVARYGGEEFVVLLPDADAPAALAVALELLAAVRAMEIAHEAWERGIVTISIGFAVTTPQPAIDSAKLIELADQALYAAKQAGRDRALMTDTMSFAG